MLKSASDFPDYSRVEHWKYGAGTVLGQDPKCSDNVIVDFDEKPEDQDAVISISAGCLEFVPEVVTLCGSTRFKKEFEALNAKLTLEGKIVISVGVFGHANDIELTESQKQKLDRIHLRKIDMSSGIYVVNVGGYIGDSTRKEIEYTKQKGKFVRYLEPVEVEVK